MSEAPEVRFLNPRPNPPAVDTDEYKRWGESLTISYEGGYIEAAYGNLVQTIDVASLSGECQDTPVAITRKAHNRVNRIGDAPTPVAAASYVQNVYPKRNSSLAAGGDRYTVVTDRGTFTARVGGDVQDLMKWACSEKAGFYAPTTFATSHGAVYGPISSTSQTN